MITVTVRMRDDKLVGLPRVGGQPVPQDTVHGLPQRERGRISGGPGVQQQRPVIAAEQVDERRLVVHGLALSQHEGVRIVSVHTDLGISVPPGRPGSVNPSHIEVAGHRGPADEVDRVTDRHGTTASAGRIGSVSPALFNLRRPPAGRLTRSSPRLIRLIMPALVIELRWPDLHDYGSHVRPRFPW